MRYLFAILILIHAGIHLLGTAKAFGWLEVNALSQPIPRPVGIVWFCAAAVLALAAALYFLSIPMWWIPALAGAFLSQILIVTHWSDARFGTVLNVVVVLVAIVGLGSWYFGNRNVDYVEKFTAHIAKLPAKNSPSVVKLETLPPPVQKWLNYAGANGDGPSMVRMKQKGEMRMKPSNAWMEFDAEQWISTNSPEFLWTVSAGHGKFMGFCGRDRLINNEGHMKIAVYGLIPVVNTDAGDDDITRGTAMRYLAEMAWAPHAARSSFVSWSALSESQFRGTLTLGSEEVSGDFAIDAQGRIIRFIGRRYYQDGDSMEMWRIDMDPASYRSFQGVRIPTEALITWELPEGDFSWYRVVVEQWVSK